MAQQALQAPRIPTRGRALFGLLDANGWGWAAVKATFWFIVMIFLLGYIPDRAYYLTVNRTLDLGILAWSPVNFCPPENETLPCPAPVGAVVPWEVAPPELSLRAPRVDGAIVQVGTKILFIGGSDGTAPTATVDRAITSGVGNFDKWSEGPPLPEARADAAVGFSAGRIFVVGGIGPDGAPTKTVFVLTPNGQTGDLGQWQTAEDVKLKLTLPEARSGASLVPAADGLFLVGGTADGKTPVKTVWKSTFDKTGALQPWQPQPELYQAATDATAAMAAGFLWVYGGTSADGPTKTVQRGEFQVNDPNTRVDESTSLARFGVAGGKVDLPEPRTNAAGFSSSGALYLIGGSDANGPRSELFWAVPDAAGNIAEWKHLPQSDLPAQGLAGSASVTLGPNVILVGGVTRDGPIAGAARANTAPQAPFFQLGLVGATVPALKIDGEIGQQLGYLNANTVGIVNFVILLIIGWAFAHKEKIRAMRDRLMARRRSGR